METITPNQKNQQVAWDNLKNAIGDELWQKYTHLTFEEMLRVPELAQYRKNIQNAIDLWYKE